MFFQLRPLQDLRYQSARSRHYLGRSQPSANYLLKASLTNIIGYTARRRRTEVYPHVMNSPQLRFAVALAAMCCVSSCTFAKLVNVKSRYLGAFGCKTVYLEAAMKRFAYLCTYNCKMQQRQSVLINLVSRNHLAAQIKAFKLTSNFFIESIYEASKKAAATQASK
jgi:hypothetical protein